MAVEITTLDNGMTVLTDAMPHLKTATVGIWVDAGARHESLAQNGISHMLEHMAFKGTQRRSALDIAEEIETVGGHLNAHTTHEATAYHARILSEDTPLAIDLLADILQNSTFDPQEIERERGVILSEIGQALDTPDDLVFDHLLEATFPGQALGRPILGTEESVTRFDGAALRGYLAERYHAPGMVLAGAGGVSHAELVELAQERFNALSREKTGGMEAAHFEPGDRRTARDLEQTHLAIAFEGVPYGDPDYYVSQVFSGVMGGGMSSRLFQEIREKRGLCYSVFSFAWSFAETGLLGFYAGASPDDVAELVPVLAGEMTRAMSDITEEEVARARAQIKAGLLMNLESSSSRAEQIARQYMIHGRVPGEEELIAEVEAVDAAALRRFAERLLRRSAPAVAAVGPLGGKGGGLESRDHIAARFTP